MSRSHHHRHHERRHSGHGERHRPHHHHHHHHSVSLEKEDGPEKGTEPVKEKAPEAEAKPVEVRAVEPGPWSDWVQGDNGRFFWQARQLPNGEWQYQFTSGYPTATGLQPQYTPDEESWLTWAGMGAGVSIPIPTQTMAPQNSATIVATGLSGQSTPTTAPEPAGETTAGSSNPVQEPEAAARDPPAKSSKGNKKSGKRRHSGVRTGA